MWLLLIFVGVLTTHFYLLVHKTHTYWKKKGVLFVKPWFFIGNMASTAFKTRAIADTVQDFYNAYPNQRYVGFYQFLQPILLIRDPELIKKITVKEFDSFPNHSIFTSTEGDPLVSRNLFNLTLDNGWYDMRTKISPTFTGFKMRAMFSLMEKCANQFVHYFVKQETEIALEMKDAFTRFTNDVIATTAFGINCDSLANRENAFYLMSKDLTNFDGIRSLKFFGYSISPTMMKLFKISTVNSGACASFKDIIKESLRIREENQIVRPDMIYLLTQARKGQLKENPDITLTKEFSVVQESELGKAKKNVFNITDDDIIAQALSFFFAGFETTSTLMCYVAYELAPNPNIQRKLREEVDATLLSSNIPLNYETLVGMRYLDKVLSETLRKWPPELLTDRRSQKDFVIEAETPGEKLLYLESGTVCWIPIYSIHRDPKYYPDPEKFDPERFSTKNKHIIKPYSYLPFGSGPRNCVGSRFALLETKLIILRILQKFEIVPVKKTQIPIKLNKRNFTMVPDAGFWLGLKPRVSLQSASL